MHARGDKFRGHVGKVTRGHGERLHTTKCKSQEYFGSRVNYILYLIYPAACLDIVPVGLKDGLRMLNFPLQISSFALLLGFLSGQMSL